MPTARRCSGCGATLNDVSEGATTITCRFCGLTHDLGGGAAHGRPVVIAVGRGPQRSARTAVLVVLSAVALVAGLGVFVAVESTRRVSTVAERLATIPAMPPDTTRRAERPGRPERLAPAALATVTQFGWNELAVAAPPGSYDGFDPVAALPWAMEIAQAWASDAVLTRIDVGRVSATGVVDLSGEDTSGYRFTSPARQMRWRQETDAGAKSLTRVGMMLQLQRGTVRALLEEGRNREEPRTIPPVSLPLGEVLDRARTGRGFGDRPFYSGYMIHLPREGWVWYFSAPSGDSFPRARARDGRTYPY